jgi:hypothetical protein
MTLDSKAKAKMRTVLLLELNSCFTKVAKQYSGHDEHHRAFLHLLIDEIKDCVSGEAWASSPFNSENSG